MDSADRDRAGTPGLGRAPEAAGRAAAKEFLAANPRYSQVEMTVDEDCISD
jgi:hypothetical protein